MVPIYIVFHFIGCQGLTIYFAIRGLHTDTIDGQIAFNIHCSSSAFNTAVIVNVICIFFPLHIHGLHIRVILVIRVVAHDVRQVDEVRARPHPGHSLLHLADPRMHTRTHTHTRTTDI